MYAESGANPLNGLKPCSTYSKDDVRLYPTETVLFITRLAMLLWAKKSPECVSFVVARLIPTIHLLSLNLLTASNPIVWLLNELPLVEILFVKIPPTKLPLPQTSLR